MNQHSYCRISKEWIPCIEVSNDHAYFKCHCGNIWSEDYIEFKGIKEATESESNTLKGMAIGTLLLGPLGLLLGSLVGDSERIIAIPPKHCNHCGYDDCYPTLKEDRGKLQFQCERCREYTWRT